MANYGYRGEEITANGKWSLLIAGGGSGQAGQVIAPTGTIGSSPAPATFNANGGIAGQTLRCESILTSTGTGAISVYDSVNAAGATATTLLWTIAATSAGSIYKLDVPTNNGLWITVAISTNITVIVT